jgi:hypothetical protein
MTRFRLIVASIMAVALMSLGAAACTPEDQIQAQTDVTNFVEFLGGAIGGTIVFTLLKALCQPVPPGCGI